MLDPGFPGRFVRDHVEEASRVGADAGLNEAELRRRLLPRHAIEADPVKPPVINIFHEIGGRGRRTARIEREDDIAERRFEPHADIARRGAIRPLGKSGMGSDKSEEQQ